MTFAMVYWAVGLLLFIFSHELAHGLNRFSVRVYEIFPSLKKILFRIGRAGSVTAITKAPFIFSG
jgi:hypothetical protein